MLRAKIYTSSLISLLACALLQPVGALTPANANDDGIRKVIQAARQAYAERDYAAAAAHYQEALALSAKLAPRLRIVLYSNLGAALRESHKYSESTDAFKNAIGIAERAHIERDAAATTAMQQYAVLLRRMGKSMDADLMEARASGVTVGNRPNLAASLLSQDEPVEQQPTLPATKKKDGSASPPRRASDISVEELKQLADAHPNEFQIWHALAAKYYLLNQWDEALHNYEILKERFPDSAKQIRLELAECYAKKQRMPAAIDELKTAINEDPDNHLPYLHLISMYSDSGDLSSAVDLAKTFVVKFPDDRNVPPLNEMITNFGRDLKTSVSNTTTQPTEAEKAWAWPDRFFPLKVYVYPFEGLHLTQSSTGITARSPNEIIGSGLDAWTQGTHGKIMFVLAQRPEEANIEVQFTNDKEDMEGELALGVTKRNTHVGDVPKARIFLLASGMDGGDIVPEELYHTILHELGHAIALSHSTDTHDIMYPAQMPGVVALTEHDCQRAIALYTH